MVVDTLEPDGVPQLLGEHGGEVRWKLDSSKRIDCVLVSEVVSM